LPLSTVTVVVLVPSSETSMAAFCFIWLTKNFYFLPKSAGTSPHFWVSHLMMGLR